MISERDTTDDYEDNIVEKSVWLDEIAVKMGVPGRQDRAYQALTVVLHVFRDSMLLHEVFTLSARLPQFLRGVFFDGYNPQESSVLIYNKELLRHFRYRMGPKTSTYFENYLYENTPEKIDGEKFLKKISTKLGAGDDVEPETAFRAVMEVLFDRVSGWENFETRVVEPQSMKQIMVKTG